MGNCLYDLLLITFSVVQGLPSAVQSHLAGQTVLSFFGTRKFISLFTKLHGCTPPWVTSVEFTYLYSLCCTILLVKWNTPVCRCAQFWHSVINIISNSQQQILKFCCGLPPPLHHHRHWDEIRYVAKWTFPPYIKQTGACECVGETEKKENIGEKY